jgi:hypothetical protein
MRARQIVFLITAAAAVACTENRSSSDTAMVLTKEADLSRRRDAANMAVGAAASAPSRAPVAFAEAPPPPPPTSPEPSQPLPAQSVVPKMVIRTGDARIKVESVDTAIVRLQELARRIGGYVANSSIQGGEKELRQATLELKMPADRYADAETGLNALGKVEYLNTNTQDVGEEFVDVTARAENARRLEQRLITLLATRTGKLEEVLSVERELARVRETIERHEGRLRYLRTRVDVSTLTVTVHEGEPIVAGLGTGNRMVEAFRNAWRNFVEFIADLIESLGVLLPLGIVAFFVGRWVWRQRSRRPPPPPPDTE